MRPFSDFGMRIRRGHIVDPLITPKKANPSKTLPSRILKQRNKKEGK